MADETCRTAGPGAVETHTCVCAVCGRNFLVARKERQGGRFPRFCSPDCRAQRAREHNRKWKKKTADRERREPATAAGRRYVPKPKSERHCAYCSKPFRTALAAKRFCCYRCSFKFRYEAGFRDFDCQRCGKTFQSGQRAAFYCSTECLAATFAEKNAGVGRRHNSVAERKRVADAKRRARFRAVSAEPYSSLEIFERDGWLCGICRKPVWATLKPPHPGSATIDHIVPVSKGGGDIKANVQCAHYGCNSRKGNRLSHGSVIQCKRTGNVNHATEKPVELLEQILSVTDLAQTVCDPFCGSGSTLIACERIGRQCYAAELTQRYCDVIVQRWESFSGGTARLDGDGRTFAEIAAERVPEQQQATQ